MVSGVVYGWGLTGYRQAPCSNFRVFLEQSHTTTRHHALGTSACCAMRTAPRGLSCCAYDKSFEPLGLSKSIVACTTSPPVVLVLGGTFLRASSEPSVARNACLQSCCSLYFVGSFLCVANLSHSTLSYKVCVYCNSYKPH